MRTGPLARCLPALLLLASCSRPSGELRFDGTVMGTTFHVRVVDAPRTPPERAALAAKVEAAIRDVDARMSTYKPQSELSRFNAHASTAGFAVSPLTSHTVAQALAFASRSGGAFDPTVGPYVDLWGFGPAPRTGKPPSDADIAALQARVGWHKVRVETGSLRKDHPDLRLDLSAIAKGTAVDAAARMLDAAGAKNFLVEVGGELFARGHNAQDRPWRVGVDKPLEGSAPGDALETVVELYNRGMATSGNYRNFFRHKGRAYSHFIDPRTGRPTAHELASATVLAPTCEEADAAATTVMVLGPEQGLAWIEGRPGYEALLILGTGEGGFRERRSSGF